MRSPALMLAMVQVQQDALAVDNDVDKKIKPKSSRRRWPSTTMSTKKKAQVQHGGWLSPTMLTHIIESPGVSLAIDDNVDVEVQE